jgi:hypothetical protein
MNSKKITKTLTITLITLLLIIPLTTVAAQPPPSDPEPTITFLGWEIVADGIKFCYEVTSGTNPSLSHWDLYSCAFKEGALVEVSESPYEYKPEEGMLKFDLGYEDGDVRIVCFVLDLDYSSVVLGDLDYDWKSGQETGSGNVEGPICPPDLLIPETRFGTLGAILPLMIALGLLMAKKNNLITVKMT